MHREQEVRLVCHEAPLVDLLTGLKLLLVWWLVLIASAAGSQLIAQFARRSEQKSKA